MLVLFQREYLQLPKLVKTLFLPEANAEPSAPQDSGAVYYHKAFCSQEG